MPISQEERTAAGGAFPNKTARLLHSFQSVALRPDHRNHGDQGPYLRDFGIAPSVASKLIRWGEQNELVCTFENANGVSGGAYHWRAKFLVDAVAKHLELFGPDDLTQDMITWADEHGERLKRQAAEATSASSVRMRASG